MRDELRHLLTKALQNEGRPSSDYDLNKDIVLPEQRKLRNAAVLVPLIVRRNTVNVVLTKRSSALRHHPGQIAFPGGKVDISDVDEQAAALREAREEIGLLSDHVDIVGTLATHETVTGFTVTPVLGLVDAEFQPIPEAGEVAEVFEVPWRHVVTQSNYSVQSRRWRGQRRYFYTVPWGPYYIWGATARILRALADRVEDGAH